MQQARNITTTNNSNNNNNNSNNCGAIHAILTMLNANNDDRSICVAPRQSVSISCWQLKKRLNETKADGAAKLG